MGYIVLVALLFILSIIWFSNHDRGTPLFLFLVEWTIIVFFATLRLYGLFDVSINTWIIIIIGIVGFSVGYGIGKRIKINHYNTDYCITESREFIPFIGNRLFWIFVAILSVVVMLSLWESINALRQGIGLGDIRAIRYGYSVEGITFGGRTQSSFSLMLGIVKDALMYILIATGINYFFEDYKRYKKNITAVLILVLATVFTNGGRFILITVLIGFVMCNALYRQQGIDTYTEYSRKFKRIMVRLAIAIAIIVTAVSIMRGITLDSLLTHVYEYICGCVVLLDKFSINVKSTGFISIFYSSMYGFGQIIFPFLHLLGIPHPGRYTATQNIVMIIQNWTQVGNTLHMNAFVTSYYAPYADLRLIGVLLYMAIFGAVVGVSYKKARECFQGKDIVFYIIMCNAIMKSFREYPFSSSSFAMILIIFWLLEFTKKIRLKTH